MANKLSKHHFWQWFMRHNKEYLGLSRKPKKEMTYWVNELNAHLRAYFKFLQFVVQYREEDNTGVLTISVAGKARYFNHVDRFVATAPAIPGWEIKALEEPRPIDFLLEEELGHIDIDPHELRCAVSDDGDQSEITVYHSLYTEEEHWIFQQVSEMAIYNILGERSFGLDIESICVTNLSCAPEDAVLIRLEELPAHVLSFKSSLMVDASGKIWEG